MQHIYTGRRPRDASGRAPHRSHLNAQENVIETWWQRQPGRLVCLSAGNPPRDFFFKPDEVDVEAFIAEHLGEHCYFCPHLFTRPRRIKENAVPAKGLWADLDEIDPSTLGGLEPTVAIRSSPHRFVGLWSTDKVVSEDLNRRLTYHVGADHSGWCFTKLLRLPGSRNHKYSSAPRAIVLWDDGPTYRVSDLERDLRVLPQRRLGNNARRPSPLSMPQIIANHPNIKSSTRRKLLGPGQIGRERRHRMHWRLANELHEAGMPADECFICLRDTKWNKHGNDVEAVWRLIDKIWVDDRVA